MKNLLGLLLLLPLTACGEDGPPAADVEGCEHLEMGPYAAITATVSKDASTPQVAADHMAYTVTMPATGIGYVAYSSAAAGDVVVFFDRNTVFAVQNSMSMPVALAGSATSSAACLTIKGRYTVNLGVGSYYFAIAPDSGGPDSGGPVKLVVEPAAQ